jgi:hypothetical protein
MGDCKKSLVGVCPHGLSVYLVDGTYCRNHYDSDFSQGGNGYRYRWISKKEIWVDEQINPEERAFIVFHECTEVELMKRGMDYDHAHNIAKRREDKLRRESRQRA